MNGCDDMASNVVFESHLKDVLKATDKQLGKAAEIIRGMMETNAKEQITEAVYESPAGWYVRTGNLRNSITGVVEKNKDGSLSIAVGSNVFYAPFVELGTGIYATEGGRQTPWKYQDANGNWHQTSGMPPRPYIRPAVENHIKDYMEVLESELSELSD